MSKMTLIDVNGKKLEIQSAAVESAMMQAIAVELGKQGKSIWIECDLMVNKAHENANDTGFCICFGVNEKS